MISPISKSRDSNPRQDFLGFCGGDHGSDQSDDGVILGPVHIDLAVPTPKRKVLVNPQLVLAIRTLGRKFV